MSATSRSTRKHSGIEPLEARIAPATVLPTIKDAELAYDQNPLTDTHFVTTRVETPILLKAGQVLTTGIRARDGAYLMFVEQGEAMIFTTDLNNNNQVDYNEITGIAAGDGLRLISFVDINGDIVTNLDGDRTLSDSNNNATGDDPFLKGDGRKLNNSRIDSIVLRSLTINDITDQDPGNDAIDAGAVDDTDVAQRMAFTTYSIHGSVLAGGGIGVSGDATSGLIIDSAGATLQSQIFLGVGTDNYYVDFIPTIGQIKVGSAASGEYFSFSVSKSDDIQGTLLTFTPGLGQAGASIVGVRAADPATNYSVTGFYAGNGGPGGAGGNIENVQLNNDINGGYIVRAGDGGRGKSGGAGGSILNFADYGSVTSEVIIQSGSGGEGTTGLGGDAGIVVLTGVVTTVDPTTGVPTASTPFNVNGGVSFVLGDGGDGFRAGGAGASLGKGIMTAPSTPVPYGRNVVGTTHDGPHDPLTGKLLVSGQIGRTLMVDFDEDGFGDIVYTTTDPSQLVVQFGDGFGGFRLDPITFEPVRIYMDAPIDGEALTVGDVNGDGHQDIITASQHPGAAGGVFVYLSKWEDANVNGLTADEDLNGNGIDEHLGFLPVRQSPLPSLVVGDPDGGLLYNLNFAFLNSGHAISDIEVGDFNGDGFTDIAVSATYIVKPPFVQPILNSVVFFMSPDIEDGRPTGEFYADFGSKKIAQPPQGANPFLPFFVMGSAVGQIEATALSTSATYDVILGIPLVNTLTVGPFTTSGASGTILIMDNSIPSILGPNPNEVRYNSPNPTISGVDTNRLLPAPGNPNITPTAVSLREMTAVDFDLDGRTDFVGLSEAPESFVVAAKGDGLGGSFVFSRNPSSPGQNRGIFLGTGPGGSYNLPGSFHGIRTVDGDADGLFSEVAILGYDGGGTRWYTYLIDFTPPPLTGLVLQPGGIAAGAAGFSLFGDGADTSVIGFDSFVPDGTVPYLVNFAVALPDTVQDSPAAHVIESSGLFSIFPVSTPLAEHYFHFTAGNGGNSLIGRGGPGGSIGGGKITTTLQTTGTVTDVIAASQFQLTLPPELEFSGDVLFQAGVGGNGFTRGGAGGKIESLVVRFAGVKHSGVTLIGGDGGLGVAAAGGSGGSIVSVSIDNAAIFQAGNGGRGLTGGAGGDIIGNGIANLYDEGGNTFSAFGGIGGEGVRRGGAGGSITGFKSDWGGTGGQFILTAGLGGNTVSGIGGAGGSIANISQVDTGNLFGGDIVLQAGDGGTGAVGGAGGSVSNFTDSPDSTELPKVLSVLAGNGGNATSGAGGAGGSVSNIVVPTKGSLDPLVPPATPYDFNRVLAGNGGSSAGSVGGAGGNVSGINSKSENNPFAVVSGAGGPGLSRGGNGGNVTNIIVDVGGSSSSKLLVIAGQGGDAGAFISNPADTAFKNQAFKAFGGKVGIGGNGGNISGVYQSGGIGSRTDLVAGNGGDTFFYGTVADNASFVGKGGSVRTVNVDGTIGNVLQNIGILSYFDYRIGQTMKTFVDTNLRDPLVAGNILDGAGNVGVVVGAAGRLKSVFSGYSTSHAPIYQSTPASGGINGDLSGIHAREIMSAVAGNVDRIAAITNVRDIVVVPGSDVGVDKLVGDPVNFRDRLGNPVPEPVIDGTLLDGAIVSAKQPLDALGKPVILSGNAFVLS